MKLCKLIKVVNCVLVLVPPTESNTNQVTIKINRVAFPLNNGGGNQYKYVDQEQSSASRVNLTPSSNGRGDIFRV